MNWNFGAVNLVNLKFPIHAKTVVNLAFRQAELTGKTRVNQVDAQNARQPALNRFDNDAVDKLTPAKIKKNLKGKITPPDRVNLTSGPFFTWGYFGLRVFSGSGGVISGFMLNPERTPMELFPGLRISLG